MEDVLPVLILYGIAGLFIYYHFLKPRLDYKKIQTYQEYSTQNPEVVTNSGVKCVHCGSQSIKRWGQKNAGDKKRIHICNKCGEKLYKTKI